MNIREALLLSKHTGSSFSRGYGWIKYCPDWTYRFSFEDITADDWEAVEVDARKAVVVECPGDMCGGTKKIRIGELEAPCSGCRACS